MSHGNVDSHGDAGAVRVLFVVSLLFCARCANLSKLQVVEYLRRYIDKARSKWFGSSMRKVRAVVKGTTITRRTLRCLCVLLFFFNSFGLLMSQFEDILQCGRILVLSG